MSKINEINKINEIEGKQLIVINGRKWQCDDLLATIHAAGKGGLLLQEPEPRALLVQPVEQEEIVARKELFEEVSAITASALPVAGARRLRQAGLWRRGRGDAEVHRGYPART